jgi:hypothetical protein
VERSGHTPTSPALQQAASELRHRRQPTILELLLSCRLAHRTPCAAPQTGAHLPPSDQADAHS